MRSLKEKRCDVQADLAFAGSTERGYGDCNRMEGKAWVQMEGRRWIG